MMDILEFWSTPMHPYPLRTLSILSMFRLQLGNRVLKKLKSQDPWEEVRIASSHWSALGLMGYSRFFEQGRDRFGCCKGRSEWSHRYRAGQELKWGICEHRRVRSKIHMESSSSASQKEPIHSRDLGDWWHQRNTSEEESIPFCEWNCNLPEEQLMSSRWRGVEDQ